jgi:hypothetical protein
MSEDHSIVPHDAWIEAREKLLAKEKAFNRLRDELSAERRALPWERVDEAHVFDGPMVAGRWPICSMGGRSLWCITSCSVPTGTKVARVAPSGPTTSMASVAIVRRQARPVRDPQHGPFMSRVYALGRQFQW